MNKVEIRKFRYFIEKNGASSTMKLSRVPTKDASGKKSQLDTSALPTKTILDEGRIDEKPTSTEHLFESAASSGKFMAASFDNIIGNFKGTTDLELALGESFGIKSSTENGHEILTEVQPKSGGSLMSDGDFQGFVDTEVSGTHI